MTKYAYDGIKYLFLENFNFLFLHIFIYYF